MSRPIFHWIGVRCVVAPIRFFSAFRQTHQLRFEYTMAQYGRQLASGCVLVSAQSVWFWKVPGCGLLCRHLTSCLLCAKFSWIVASCSGISFSLLSPTARCAFKFVEERLWMEHWRGGGGWSLEEVPLSNFARSLARIVDPSFNIGNANGLIYNTSLVFEVLICL